MTPNHKNKPQDEIRSTAKQCENFIKAAGAFEWKAWVTVEFMMR